MVPNLSNINSMNQTWIVIWSSISGSLNDIFMAEFIHMAKFWYVGTWWSNKVDRAVDNLEYKLSSLTILLLLASGPCPSFKSSTVTPLGNFLFCGALAGVWFCLGVFTGSFLTCCCGVLLCCCCCLSFPCVCGVLPCCLSLPWVCGVLACLSLPWVWVVSGWSLILVCCWGYLFR